MATTIFARNTKTQPAAVPQNGYLDMLPAGLSVVTLSASTAEAAPAERPILLSGVPVRWWSERVTTEVTISGSITFVVSGSSPATYTGKFRCRLFKITAGGSNVESLIATADAAAGLTTTTTAFSFSVTPSAPVTVSPGERFILEVVMTPTAADYGTGNATLYYNGSSGNQRTTVTFTETVAFKANGTKLYFHRTNDAGIGTFFDMTPTLGSSAFTTGVVNTSAGGTEIQWTRTAGGTVLEWISGRMKAPGWTVTGVNSFQGTYHAIESNLAANCSGRQKAFLRKPDGTETLVWTNNDPAEYQTTDFAGAGQNMQAGPTLNNAVSFAEDDRIVLRIYIRPVGGTMGGGFTCTLNYDAPTDPTNGAIGDSFLTIVDGPDFKAEGDPAGTSRVPGALPMLGVGN